MVGLPSSRPLARNSAIPGLHPLRLGRLTGHEATQADRPVEVIVLPAGALRHRKPASPRTGRIVVVDHVDAAGRRAAGRDGEILRQLRRGHGDRAAVLVHRGVAIAAEAVAHVEPPMVIGVFGRRRVRRDEIAEGMADVRVGVPAVGVHAVEQFLRLRFERVGVEKALVVHPAWPSSSGPVKRDRVAQRRFVLPPVGQVLGYRDGAFQRQAAAQKRPRCRPHWMSDNLALSDAEAPISASTLASLLPRLICVQMPIGIHFFVRQTESRFLTSSCRAKRRTIAARRDRPTDLLAGITAEPSFPRNAPLVADLIARNQPKARAVSGELARLAQMRRQNSTPCRASSQRSTSSTFRFRSKHDNALPIIVTRG